ncbi:unnamed protein product [Hapterophycus canaliculatus]
MSVFRLCPKEGQDRPGVFRRLGFKRLRPWWCVFARLKAEPLQASRGWIGFLRHARGRFAVLVHVERVCVSFFCRRPIEDSAVVCDIVCFTTHSKFVFLARCSTELRKRGSSLSRQDRALSPWQKSTTGTRGGK